MKTPCTRILIQYYADGTDSSVELDPSDIIIKPSELAGFILNCKCISKESLIDIINAASYVLKSNIETKAVGSTREQQNKLHAALAGINNPQL